MAQDLSPHGFGHYAYVLFSGGISSSVHLYQAGKSFRCCRISEAMNFIMTGQRMPFSPFLRHLL